MVPATVPSEAHTLEFVRNMRVRKTDKEMTLQPVCMPPPFRRQMMVRGWKRARWEDPIPNSAAENVK
jgi:hypothetical protein